MAVKELEDIINQGAILKITDQDGNTFVDSVLCGYAKNYKKKNLFYVEMFPESQQHTHVIEEIKSIKTSDGEIVVENEENDTFTFNAMTDQEMMDNHDRFRELLDRNSDLKEFIDNEFKHYRNS